MGNGFTLSVAEGEWVYPERSRRGIKLSFFVLYEAHGGSCTILNNRPEPLIFR